MLCSSSFYSFIEHFFCASLLFDDIPYLAKLRQKNVTTQSGENLRSFVFALFWNLIFMRKSSKPRIYADLVRFT